jgi:hypothetical protein
MAKYDENDGSWLASDNSRHYSEFDADKHSSMISSGGYRDSGGYATQGAELLEGLTNMSEGMMLSVVTAVMTAGIMFAYFFFGNTYGYAVYINWWFLILPLLVGVVMKVLYAAWRPAAGIVIGILSIAMGTLLWLNLRTQEELKLYQATMTEGAKMYAEPSEKAKALPRYKNNPVEALGVTKDGWVLAESSDLNIGWVKAENISVNGGKELKPIQTAVVLVNKLNIHSYSRLASTIQTHSELKFAPKGTRVIVTGAEEDGWLPVYYFIRDQYQKGNSIKGYVPANNIFIEDGSGTTKSAKLIAPQGIKEITVTGYTSIFLFSRTYNDVRFHNKEIPVGDKFIMLEKPTEKGWIKAWYDGVEGWVKVYDLNKLKIEY